jgi:hypothetical protein
MQCNIFVYTEIEQKKTAVRFIYILVQILVHSHFELISSILDLDATEPVSQPVSQTAVEMISIHLISVQQKR